MNEPTKKIPIGSLKQDEPNHVRMRKAKIQLGETLSRMEKEFNLTPSEIFLLLADEMHDWADSCVRSERAASKESN